MKTRDKLFLAPLAVAIAGALVLYGCGSGGDGDVTVAGAAVPVAGAGSPFIGVMMKVTCADGNTGQASIGTSALPGEGIVNVSGACPPPIRIEAIGAGKMRPIGAKSDGSEDVRYDPAVNLPVSNVLATIPTTPAPVNPATTLVANQVTAAGLAAETSTTLDAKKTAVAAALGLVGGKADLDKDYRNAGVAAASTAIVEVAALAAANAATNGMPATVTSTKSLGQVIAEGLGNQAKTAAAGSLSTATGIATALKAVDPIKLDVSTAAFAANIANINLDAGRVNNLIALNVPASTASIGKVNALVADAAAAAAAAAAPNAAQTQLIADVKARGQQVAQDAVRDAAAKMVAGVTTSSASPTAVSVVKAAATKIVGDNTTFMQQTGAKPADIAAQARAIAESVSAAIVADTAATTGIFDTPPAVGTAGAAAALVGQLENTAAVKAVTATSTTTFNTTTAGADALKVATAIVGIAAPLATATAATQAAFLAAVGAVAGVVNPATVNVTDTTTKTNLTTTIDTLQTSLVTAIGTTSTESGSAGALAQQAASTVMGTTLLSFATPPTIGTTPLTLPTTTTTSSTSSTTKATTTTTTVAPTTTTAAATTTTTKAATTTTAAAATTTTAAATTTTAAPTTTTTTTVATTTTTTAVGAAAACRVAIGSAVGYVTGAPICSPGVLNADGGGATVTSASVPTGVTAFAYSSLGTCDPFGAPPAAGATTLTPCKP